MEADAIVHAEVLRLVEQLQAELRDVRQRATLVLVALAIIVGTVAPATVAGSNGNLSGWAYAGGIAGGVCLVLLLSAIGPMPGAGFVTDPLGMARDHDGSELPRALSEDLAGRLAQSSAALRARSQALQAAVLLLGISTVAWLIAVGKL